MEERKHIFVAGSRGAAAAAAPGGAGLGLALARRLAQSVGGEIAAEPTQHGGRFTISLPLA
jgi:signal transduction histidine kinase